MGQLARTDQMNYFERRLKNLEEQIMPAAQAIVIDVVFVDAATRQGTPDFQVRISIGGYPGVRRYGGRSAKRGR
jgi:hypothetical protein